MGNKITRTSFRLPDDTYQAFAILARQRRRSIGDAVLEAMRMWMDAPGPPQRITPPSIAPKNNSEMTSTINFPAGIQSILGGPNTVAKRLMLATIEAVEVIHGKPAFDTEHPDVQSVAKALAGAAGVERENSGTNQPGTTHRKSDPGRDKVRSSR